jgi:predicted RNA-binding Zn ribbon-like protein
MRFLVRSQYGLNTYNKQRAILAEDLINTFDLYLEEPEHLREPEDLQRFLVKHGIKPTDKVTENDLEQVRVLREELRECWTAPTVAEAIEKLNPLLNQAAVKVKLTCDSTDQLQVQFVAQSGLALVQQLAFEGAMGIIGLLQEHGHERLRACVSSPCQDVFVDTSRNKSRRFCSERCANRYNIAAFRERQKG